MADYILLMHNDTGPEPDWGLYLKKLQELGVLRGGSAMGGGECARKLGAVPPISGHLSGFIRIEADNLQHARTFLDGNPVFEAGGTVEIRELPRTD